MLFKYHTFFYLNAHICSTLLITCLSFYPNLNRNHKNLILNITLKIAPNVLMFGGQLIRKTGKLPSITGEDCCFTSLKSTHVFRQFRFQMENFLSNAPIQPLHSRGMRTTEEILRQKTNCLNTRVMFGLVKPNFHQSLMIFHRQS